LQRILAELDADKLLDVLSERLSGSELTTLMLEVARRRAGELSPADVMRQYRTDRFVAPGQVDPILLAELRLDALREGATTFEPIQVAPLAPLGAHSTIGGIDQNRVVTTLRGNEVAADPANSLAFEAAACRALMQATDPKSSRTVRLATVSHVTRAQRFEGPRSFAHFTLFGMVSAGRDAGHHHFEQVETITQLGAMIALIRSRCSYPINVRLTDFDGRFGPAVDAIGDGIRSDGVSVERWPERDAGRGYYTDLCFKVDVDVDGDPWEIGDGGAVDWTQRLLQNRKERLVMSGLSLDRLVMLLPQHG
jgi:hypothetical protein